MTSHLQWAFSVSYCSDNLSFSCSLINWLNHWGRSDRSDCVTFKDLRCFHYCMNCFDVSSNDAVLFLKYNHHIGSFPSFIFILLLQELNNYVGQMLRSSDYLNITVTPVSCPLNIAVFTCLHPLGSFKTMDLWTSIRRRVEYPIIVAITLSKKFHFR